ncbi:MAG: lipid A deacylase LpxR family protein [Planctomycetota bacterium]
MPQDQSDVLGDIMLFVHEQDRAFEPPSQPLGGLFGTPFTQRIYWENDGAFHDPTDGYDRHYTNGFTITLEHQPEWADRLATIVPGPNVDATQASTAAGYVLGQLIFTPANLGATAPITTDQPYAGYLYGGAFWQRQAPSTIRPGVAVLDHLELNVGVIGQSSLAEDIQEWVHENFEGDPIFGWGNQRDDEFTAQFFLRRKWRFDTGGTSLPLLGDVDTQLIPQAGLALGTVYRYAEAAATFRVGHNLPDDFGPGRINDLQSAAGAQDPTPGWSWYTWMRLGARATQYNTFLDGSEFQDPSQAVDRNPLVGEVQGGLSAGYRCGRHRLEATWGITWLTDEIDDVGGDGTESYGTLILSYTYGF